MKSDYDGVLRCAERGAIYYPGMQHYLACTRHLWPGHPTCRSIWLVDVLSARGHFAIAYGPAVATEAPQAMVERAMAGRLAAGAFSSCDS